RENMDGLETCCLCEGAAWSNDRELTIWHVNSNHLPVHLDCWIRGYFTERDAVRVRSGLRVCHSGLRRRIKHRGALDNRGFYPLIDVWLAAPSQSSIGRAGGDGQMAEDVSDIIVAKIRSGTLPGQDTSGKSYAGKGTDKPCDGCDQRVSPEDVEYEID